MDSRELAESFVRNFCTADIAGIESVLSENFRLRGPLFEFSSKVTYIASLGGDLEPDTSFEILSIIGSAGEAAAFYTYNGNAIGQLFRCEGGKICESILVFDTRAVA